MLLVLLQVRVYFSAVKLHALGLLHISICAVKLHALGLLHISICAVKRHSLGFLHVTSCAVNTRLWVSFVWCKASCFRCLTCALWYLKASYFGCFHVFSCSIKPHALCLPFISYCALGVLREFDSTSSTNENSNIFTSPCS